MNVNVDVDVGVAVIVTLFVVVSRSVVLLWICWFMIGTVPYLVKGRV